ncbi:hypothetical protein [Hyalangium versicolor]|uniref:hypothetical protein n=1 Tax=Hyalangium versicolor TaxID=2861190 RepID=UPI001CCE9F34|nr:hypothetical protein [Hyalangium versicolor]
MAITVHALRDRLSRALGFLDAPAELQEGESGAGAGVLLLLPLLLVFPLLLSGLFRAALGVGISTGLGLGVIVAGAVLALVFLSGRPKVEDRFLLVQSVLVLAAAMVIVVWALYTPAFEGMVSVGGGDAGNHVSLKRHFIETEPDTYQKFVTFYALTHWLEVFFGLDAFESFRAGFYAIPLLVTLCLLAALAAVSRAGADRGKAPARLAQWLFLAGFGVLGTNILFRVLHYHQADGFYVHLFGLVPTVLCWVLFGLSRTRALRVAMLLFAIVLHRFTYGLNLGDVAAVSAVLTAVEAGGVSHSKRLRWGLIALAVGLGGAAAFAYRTLWQLHPVWGAIIAPEIHAMIRGEAFLTVLLLILPFAARRMGLPLGAEGARLARYAGVFGAINTFIQFLYLRMGFKPEYYLFKYHLHGMVLVFGAALVLISALAAQALVQWGQRKPRASHAVLVPLVALWGIALFNLYAACRPYRDSFHERRFGTPPWRWLQPLVDREGQRRIEATLAREGAAFGGLLAPSWPLMNFMNASLRRTVDADPLLFGWLQYTHGRVRQEPGFCVFWYATDADFAGYAADQAEQGGELADVTQALHNLTGRRCEDYRAGWDEQLALRLCYLCEPARPVNGSETPRP